MNPILENTMKAGERAMAAHGEGQGPEGVPPAQEGVEVLDCGKPCLPIPDSEEEFDTQEFPKRDPVVEGLINRGDCALLAALTGTGKTWAMIDCGLHVSRGREWMGRFKTMKGDVVAVFFEGGGDKIRERIQLIRNARGMQVGEGRFLPLIVTPKLGLNFGNFRDWFLQSLHSKKMLGDIVLSIFDPGSYLFASGGFNENDNAHGTRFATEFQAIAEEGTMGVWLTWHTGQNPNPKADPITLARGATGLASAFEDKEAMVWDTLGGKRELVFKGFGRDLEPFDYRWKFNLPVFEWAVAPGDLIPNGTTGGNSGGTGGKALTPERLASLFEDDPERTFYRADLIRAIDENGWGGKTTANDFITGAAADESGRGLLVKRGTSTKPTYGLGERGKAILRDTRRLDPYHVTNDPADRLTDGDIRQLAALFGSAEEAEQGVARKTLADTRGKAQLLKPAKVDDLLCRALTAGLLECDGATVPAYRLRGKALEVRRGMDAAAGLASPQAT